MIGLPPGFYDPVTHRLHGPNGQQHFTPTMHRILMTLAGARGRAVTNGMMIERLWRVNDEPENADDVVKVTVHKMRERMREVGIDRATIGTRHHVGYFLAPSPAPPAIAVTDRDRAELCALLSTHPERERAVALLARMFDET